MAKALALCALLVLAAAGAWLSFAPGAELARARLGDTREAVLGPEIEVRYQYVDEAGIVRLVSSLDLVPPDWRDRAGRIEIEHPRERPAGAQAAAGARRARPGAKHVTFYTMQGCGWCAKTEDWLNAHHVSYTTVDVDRDRAAAQALFERAGRVVTPTLDVDGTVIFGYDPGRFGQVIGG